MIKFVLFIFVCTVISRSYLQEIIQSFPPSQQPISQIGSDGSLTWPFQNYQEQQRKVVKPCPRRRKLNNAEEQWIPSFSAKVSHPLHSPPILEPQALKNEDPMILEDVSKSDLSDPKLEQEINKLSPPERRTLYVANMKPSDLNDEDCEEMDPTRDQPTFTPDPEHIAMNLIKDCLEKKHKKKLALELSTRSSSDSLNVYSRRSMSAPDADDSGYLEDDEDETDASAKNANANNTDTDINKADRRSANTFVGLGSLIENSPRVCFACSTATNPLCWEPDQKTTIKYCTKEQSCVTKTFGVKNSLAIIRDCANTCDDTSVPGVEPKFKSCKLCHKDYCNGANSINGYIYNLAIILVVSITKYTFDF